MASTTPSVKKPSLSAKKPSLGKLGSRKAKTVNVQATELVKSSFLAESQTLPIVIEPTKEGVDLVSWAASSRGFIEKNLLKYGGVLFRGFEISSPESFQDLIDALGHNALEYTERSSPRSRVDGNIYTSTDYPPQYPIFLHNENSYAHVWPQKIFFYCHVAPEVGGETPIADVRRVYQAIPQEIRTRFEEKGILYVRNFSDVAGLPWQSVFQTDDKDEVAAYATKAGYEIEWQDGNRLRTKRQGAASYLHPKTGEPVWFNHGTFFHVSTLVPEIRQGLLAQFAEEDLPNHTFYGDGTPIEPEALEILRSIYHQETIKFPWRRGDVLMLDNMLVAHAREPFEGDRSILAGMAEPLEKTRLEQP
ncbi:MAG: TauD/TfdA family dioxygenase [Acidobacteriota bacterium]